jgi:hypothetical protein
MEGRFVAVSWNKEIPGQIVNVYTERVINGECSGYLSLHLF